MFLSTIRIKVLNITPCCDKIIPPEHKIIFRLVKTRIPKIPGKYFVRCRLCHNFYDSISSKNQLSVVEIGGGESPNFPGQCPGASGTWPGLFCELRCDPGQLSGSVLDQSGVTKFICPDF